eukprot:m.16103 g.16103  ORF g.16103 m.16103 type:complete len:648 (+) comp6928_c0_seq2:389-2332(+)
MASTSASTASAAVSVDGQQVQHHAVTAAKEQSGLKTGVTQRAAAAVSHVPPVAVSCQSTASRATTTVAAASALLSDSIITLNVGGVLFMTSRATLERGNSGDQESFLGALLSGRLPALCDENGALFIDRDPHLFSVILNYLRSSYLRLNDVEPAELLHEAKFYGIASLIAELEIHAPNAEACACGGMLYDGTIPPLNVEDGPVVCLSSANALLAVAHEHVVTCWKYSDCGSWRWLARSQIFEESISCLALNVQSGGSTSETTVALSLGPRVIVWSLGRRTIHRRPTSPPGPDMLLSSEGSDDDERDHQDMVTLGLKAPIDQLSFVNNNLVAVSFSKGDVGVRNARTLLWQVQTVGPLGAFDASSNQLLFGTTSGKILLVDLQKFPLRLKDNDLLVNTLYKDPNAEAITALSVFMSSLGGERCMEIAYGTETGTVRVVQQLPETIGQAPQLYQTYRVHQSAIRSVSLSQNHLISMCSTDNHVRSWRVARFRGRISIQPGSQSLGSFAVPGAVDGGPFGEADQLLLFVQCPSSDTLALCTAATGERLTMITTVGPSPISRFHLPSGFAVRGASGVRRYLFTGHEDGAVQVWDIFTAIEGFMADSYRPPQNIEPSAGVTRTKSISRLSLSTPHNMVGYASRRRPTRSSNA